MNPRSRRVAVVHAVAPSDAAVSLRENRYGGRFTYHGGWATESPVQMRPPSNGHWHVVVDPAGRGGQMRAGIRVVGTAETPAVLEGV